jgi:hypothetical protein
MLSMIKRLAQSVALVLGLGAFLASPPAGAARIAPHRALYTMQLGTAREGSSILDAQGLMAYEWGETCNGWTVQQRYKLGMHYSGTPAVEIRSNFVTWESKDGLRYRFNQKETRNGEVEEDIRGHARLDGPGEGGIATFERPQPLILHLPKGTLFPSAHTILLIDSAKQGKTFLLRQVFDGATTDNAVQVSAVIGHKLVADAAAKQNPLLEQPGWPVRLAFFPTDMNIERPDYELGMQLLDNGVSKSMVIDYGDYSIRATLDRIEALPHPQC